MSYLFNLIVMRRRGEKNENVKNRDFIILMTTFINCWIFGLKLAVYFSFLFTCS